ncbi:glycosyltransferase [Defluviimonas sp. CAU 1641]|uniref:Glycosyltransferase n=1 Tax=Defluviimonas salinarum TaxID=2992147 RepID=A0ABT3J2V0_9RHOB|nr:glycosyltransferase [Defluviimonas salinarum]
MADPAPISIALRIDDGLRQSYLALLFLASCGEFLRNPIRQVLIHGRREEDLSVLREEMGLFGDLAVSFSVGPELPDAPTDELWLVGEPAFFFSRDLTLSDGFAISAASGSLALLHGPGAPTSAVPEGIVAFDDGLAANGLVTGKSLLDHSPQEVARVQQAFRTVFSNRAFWNRRYALCPQLGSGLGSRGRFQELKRRILTDFVVDPGHSVLDVGCGDLEVVKDLRFASYTGMDVSETSIHHARDIRPEWTFHLGSTEQIDPPGADAVICFDVLIHQPTVEKARALIDFLSAHARRRLIVSGYDRPVESRHIVYSHRPLHALLRELDGWKEPVKIAAYHDMSVYMMDRIDTDDDSAMPMPAAVAPKKCSPLVTVTVNTYNNQDQILRCLNSLARQSEGNVAVNVIDDGSEDGTRTLVTEFANADPRFRLVGGPNKGISARRNEGLRLAHGTYHLFVDGDDWLPDDAIATLLDLATESGAEIVRGSHLFYNLNGKSGFEVNPLEQMHQPEIRAARFDAVPSLTMLWTTWNTLIHRRVIADNYLRFHEDLMLGEDRIFLLEAFMACRSITMTKEVTYYWDRSDKWHGSLSRSQDPAQRLRAIRLWLALARRDASCSRRHRDMVEVSAFHEAVKILLEQPKMPTALAIGYHRLLETMDFPPRLLRDRTIKGWQGSIEERSCQIYDDLRRIGRIDCDNLI